MPAVAGALIVAPCGKVPFTARLCVEYVNRLLPAALVALWFTRTTVCDAFAVAVPPFRVVHVAVTVPPGPTEVGLTA